MGDTYVKKVWAKMTHTISIKTLSENMDTELNRCLTTFDLTWIGIGATIGSGIYIVVGIIAKEQAGKLHAVKYILTKKKRSTLLTSLPHPDYQ